MTFNVFSAFDGISCGQQALLNLGIIPTNFYASEIDKNAIKICNKNFPNTIHLGDITKITKEQLLSLPKIDLLIGGSPCQGFSIAGKKLNFDDPRSKLFFEFVRILKILKPRYFLLENVKMNEESRNIITKYLKVKPVYIDSKIFSAQTRKRYYWTNIPINDLPAGCGLLIRDIIYDNSYCNFTLSDKVAATQLPRLNCIQWDNTGANWKSQMDRGYYMFGKFGCITKMGSHGLNILLDYSKNLYRKTHPVEVERAMGLPDHYTDVPGLSHNIRKAACGNGWEVNTISHLFKHLQETKRNVNSSKKVA